MHMNKQTIRQKNWRARKAKALQLITIRALIAGYGEGATLISIRNKLIEDLESLELNKGELNVRKKK